MTNNRSKCSITDVPRGTVVIIGELTYSQPVHSRNSKNVKLAAAESETVDSLGR